MDQLDLVFGICPSLTSVAPSHRIHSHGLTKGTTVKEDGALRPGVELDDEGQNRRDGRRVQESFDADRRVVPGLVVRECPLNGVRGRVLRVEQVVI